MEIAAIFALVLGGSLVLVLLLRYLIRELAFRFMTFEVRARGRTFTYNRERFRDEEGRSVTDPALLAELEEEWRHRIADGDEGPPLTWLPYPLEPRHRSSASAGGQPS